LKKAYGIFVAFIVFMSHTTHHSKSSVATWGGKPEDYQKIHDWLDATKETFADWRHRALRHHSQGIFEAERLFGLEIINSDKKPVPVRYICEQHIMEDCGGRIPTVADWFRNIKQEGWMSRGYVFEGTNPEMNAAKPRYRKKVA
jgi:hypothetical protein